MKKELELKAQYHEHFVLFFKAINYTELSEKSIRIVDINSHKDISKLIYGTGLYIILTDYQIEENSCSLFVDDLKAIYRGHGTRLKKRVESHLYNIIYNKNRKRTNYTVCMKLDNKKGINLNEEPFSNYKWKVITHSMPNSSKIMREQAEKAFDSVYSRPLASNA